LPFRREDFGVFQRRRNRILGRQPRREKQERKYCYKNDI
jgi:hypothetical protein